jgi:hypothetical protein
MVSGRVSFKASNFEDLHHKIILKGRYIRPNFISAEAIDMINGFLQLNRRSRILPC